jgi:protein TonB
MKTTAKNGFDKRAEKRQINIRWNSRLFFQIGVIVSLLFVFFVMQTNFEKTVSEVKLPPFEGLEEPPLVNYVIEIDQPKPVEPVQKPVKKPVQVAKVVNSSEFVVKPNSSPEVETTVAPTDVAAAEVPVETIPISEPVASEPKNMLNVEFVPIFPGCETMATNAEKVDCMSGKINNFINKNFRKEVMEKLNSNEVYRIYVNFKIDSDGYISEVKAQSQSEVLKREATRVIKTLPIFKPGRQGNKNVDVLYTVPIIIQVQ